MSDADEKQDVRVDYFVVGICDLCRTGVPGECHVPGCMFWMCDAPALPYVQKLTILPAKFEFNEGWNRG